MTPPRTHATAAMERPARNKSSYLTHWGINMCAFRIYPSHCVQALTCACLMSIPRFPMRTPKRTRGKVLTALSFLFNDTLDTYALKPLA